MSKRQTVMLQYLKDDPRPSIHSNSIPVSKNNVFYFQVVEQGYSVPFLKHRAYLTEMANNYPNLQFNIVYLIDDTLRSFFRCPKRGSFLNKLLPNTASCKIDDNLKRVITDFEKKNDNANVTAMLLSKFMSNTVLKYKWRSMSVCQVSFYAKVYAVWKQGGISLDLPTFYNKFLKHENFDNKIKTIFENFNNKIGHIESTTLNTLLNHENNEFYQLITLSFSSPFINQSLNLTSSIPINDSSKLLTNVHRSKRELVELNEASSSIIENDNSITRNHSDIINITKKQINFPTNKDKKYIKKYDQNLTDSVKNFNNSGNKLFSLELPQIMYYMFSFLNDDGISGPQYSVINAENSIVQDNMLETKYEEFTKQVAIDSDGNFIAAYYHSHPFLDHLLSLADHIHLPKYSIQETILTQCSGFFIRNSYCNSILLI